MTPHNELDCPLSPSIPSDVGLSVAVFWETCGECIAGWLSGQKRELCWRRTILGEMLLYGVKSKQQINHVSEKVVERMCGDIVKA